MGRVFLGRSPSGRHVAVKVVHAELVRQEEFRSRFRREVEAARLVSGAFTAPVINADPEAVQPWLVTSYIAGPSLQQTVDDGGPLPPATVLILAAGLAEALMSIHRVGLVHRDLKPSNVLLAEDGPRVIDFGIARTLEAGSLTRPGLMVGSPGFMAPEQINGDEVTAAADVFALGAVLAYAAMGTNPFGQSAAPTLLYRVVHAEPDIEAITDPVLRTLVADCLAKVPGARPTPRQILTRVGFGNGGSPIALMKAPEWLPAAHRAMMSGTHSYRQGENIALADTFSRNTPVHLATQVDTARPQVDTGQQQAPRASRTRRTFLLSGLAALAVAGATTGVVLTRSTGHRIAMGSEGVGASSVPSRSSAVSLPKPVGDWALDEGSGTLAADSTGRHDGTETGVQWRAGDGGAAAFDGVSSRISTQTQVLDTGAGHSFTVSAWVWMSGTPSHFATVVSQDATVYSSFYLQYSSDDHRWAFALPGIRALSATPPATNTWTHLVGVNDASSNQIRLYVDGAQQGAASVAKPVATTGSLMIGCGTSDSQPVDFFPGAIKDVQVFDQVLSLSQIKALP